MDFGENMFCLNNHIMREQSENTGISNNNTFAWYSLSSSSSPSSWQPSNTCSSTLLINAFHTTAAETNSAATHHHHQPLYGGDGSHVHPDPHLTCLKLGKRHYFEDTNTNSCSNSSNNSNNSNVANACVAPPLGERHVSVSVGGKGYYCGGGGGGERTATAGAVVAKCQVEGCQVALVNSKEYHRRHKVCEVHSKAPKVVVLGREQRFCQQCSRFHVVSEFDESKRSCRRRLAGHNERRRKSSHHSHSLARNNSTQGCALSLLSPPGSESWLSHADLSMRCSAALHELIAENRAALMIRQQQQQQQQLVLDRDWHLRQNDNDDAVQDSSKQIHQPDPNYFAQQIFPHTQ